MQPIVCWTDNYNHLTNLMPEPIKLFMVDSVGAHRGMHYFNFPLVTALQEVGIRVSLLSNEKTITHPNRPGAVPLKAAFRGIYGAQPKWLRGLRYFSGLIRVGWWTIREKPDVIHFHFFQVPALDLLLLRWLRSRAIVTVISVHDVLPFVQKERAAPSRDNRFRQLYVAAHHLVTHSEYAREALIQLDTAFGEKSTVVPQGHYLDLVARSRLSQQTARRRLGLPEDRPIILVFGTIKPNKRLDLALAAVALLRQRYPDILLVIAGKAQGQTLDGLHRQAESLAIADNVIWRDTFIPDSETSAYYLAASVVLLPYAWIYQSATLIMAMSYGCAVVATDVGSNGEYVHDGTTGRLVALDANAIADAISTLLADPSQALMLGQAARRYVASELGWDRIALRLEILYTSVRQANSQNA